ncbi:MAG: nucleotidyltransferase domain-containing protein [Chloroflexota bacterium]|nr:nucleotidyltransferase domain-containing protein [Chloroflexota bacterium]
MKIIDETLIAAITRTVVEHRNPRRIILFGSYARGDAGPDSDLDIFVEMETRSRNRSVNTIHMLFGRHEWAMDVIVYTPEDVKKWRRQVGTMFYVIEKEGRVLYERSEAALPLVAHESSGC